MRDSDIVELYLKREEDAIRQTRLKYGVRLCSLTLGIVQNRQTAEECENDIYLQAWNSIPPHEPRTYFYPFLARIARHIALDCCKKKNSLKRNAQLVEFSRELEQCIPAPENAELQMEESMLRTALNDFLRGLNPIHRKVFLRRYWYMETIEEISNRFGFTQSKIKSILFRTRKKLRTYLEQEGISV